MDRYDIPIDMNEYMMYMVLYIYLIHNYIAVILYIHHHDTPKSIRYSIICLQENNSKHPAIGVWKCLGDAPALFFMSFRITS